MNAPLPESQPTAHVLLVEDLPELASAFARTLETAGYRVTVARNYAQAKLLVGRTDLHYDAAILDHRLPDGDSRDLVSSLASREPYCSSLILTACGNRNLAQEYRGRGAFRYAGKPIGGVQLLSHVQATIADTHRWRVAGEDSVERASEPPAVVVDMEQAADRLRYVAKLSPTERDVAYWVLQGKRDAEIATLLGRAERTAKRHVGQVLAKAGVQNRASLWAFLGKDGDALLERAKEKAKKDEEPGSGASPATSPR